MPAVPTDADRLQEYERCVPARRAAAVQRGFLGRGGRLQPHGPLLGLVFFGELLGAINLDWPGGRTCSRSPAAWRCCWARSGLINKAKGRPFSTVPRRLGSAELAGFVVVPGVAAGDLRRAGQQRRGHPGANLALLVMIYAMVGSA